MNCGHCRDSSIIYQYVVTCCNPLAAYPDGQRLLAAETLLIKQKSGNSGIGASVDGFFLVPDGGNPQYASLITQYSNERPDFAGYIARARTILGF
jgi:hypothetical protein